MTLDFKRILGAVPVPYVLLDLDFRIVWANRAYEEVTGRSFASVSGLPLLEAFPADAQSVSHRMLDGSLRHVRQTGAQDHLPLIPYPIAGADGETRDRYWSATHTPVLDDDGNLAFILQNTNDVTDYHRGAAGGLAQDVRRGEFFRRAEAVAIENLQLEATSSFLREIFEQAPSFIAVLRGPDHVFTLANREYLKLVGRDDVIGQTARAVLRGADGQGFFELLDKVYRSGEPVMLRNAEITLQGVGGSPRLHYLDFIYQPLLGQDGKATGIFVQGHDVTQTRLAELDLRAAERRFRLKAQNLPVHVWTAGPDGALDWFNDKVYQYSGRGIDALAGRGWLDIVHPDDVALCDAAWRKAVEQRQVYETEFRIRRHDGSYRWHLVRATPIMEDRESAIRWIGSNTDIQDRMTAEAAVSDLNATLEARVDQRNRELEGLHEALRQSQKLEAIGGLAGGIAHDFNNLLQTISASLTLAGRDIASGSAARQRLDMAMTAVERGAQLASQLLSFGRRQALSPRPTDLGLLLAEQRPMIETAVGEGITVDRDVAPGLWTTSIDPANFQNALLNLLLNARDAMDRRGRVVIRLRNATLSRHDVRLCPGLQPGDYVQVEIGDDGRGIPAALRDRVVEPFFTTKPPGEGTGLGLAMVYGFVRQSGGDLRIDCGQDEAGQGQAGQGQAGQGRDGQAQDGAGRGTTVVLYLPRTRDAVAPRTEAPELPAGGNERILVVEDDPGVRTSLALLLADLGYTVATAEDADKAHALLLDGLTLDLLLTDVVMPGTLSGRDLARAAKALHPDLAILFTSGFVADELCLTDGVQLLCKPYSEEVLARKVRDALRAAQRAGADESADERADDRGNEDGAAPVHAAPQDHAGPLAGLHIVVCEDEAIIRLNLVDELEYLGAWVAASASGADALRCLDAGACDLLITDLGLPDMTGLELARAIRARRPDLPVIFATGHDGVPGAEALGRTRTLHKPFSGRLLEEAITALVSHPPAAATS